VYLYTQYTQNLEDRKIYFGNKINPYYLCFSSFKGFPTATINSTVNGKQDGNPDKVCNSNF